MYNDKICASDSIECILTRNGIVINDEPFWKRVKKFFKKLFRLRLIFISVGKSKGLLIIINDGKIVIKEKPCLKN